MTEYFVKFGVKEDAAATIAADLIAKVDASPVGRMVKYVVRESHVAAKKQS